MRPFVKNLLVLWRAIGFRCCCLTLAWSLASCAVVEPTYPPHFVDTRNAGVGSLSDVVIDYGKPYLLRNSTPTKPGRMTSNSVGAPVPDQMIVTWKTADGTERKLLVPVKSKLSYVEKLRGFELVFYDERLEVYHLTSSGTRGEFTNRKRIYPEPD